MKAWVLEDVGDIQYKEAAKPHISENEVLVAVKVRKGSMSCAEITVISVPDGTADLRSMSQCRSATSLNCRKMFHMRKRQCLNRCRWHAMHCAV